MNVNVTPVMIWGRTGSVQTTFKLFYLIIHLFSTAERYSKKHNLKEKAILRKFFCIKIVILLTFICITLNC